MTNTLLPFEEVNIGENPKHCVIWLHGLGANGHDFVPIAGELNLTKPMRHIFPHAPSRPVTVNGGMTMPAWYDIYSMSIDREIDVPQIMASAAAIQALVAAQQTQGISADHCIIIGFSQGGAVAYQAALSYPEKLLGLAALSTYFATEKELVLSEANAGIATLIQHGTHDPVVPAMLGERAASQLKNKGLKPKHMTYPMEHSLCADQIHDISEWINERLA